MKSPSDRTATPAGFRRNAWLASIGTGGWFASESVAGFVGIRNVTQAKQARDEIERIRADVQTAAERLSAVLESTTDGVILLDQDWRVTYVNRQAATMLAPRGLHLGASARDAFPEEAWQSFHQHCREAQDGRTATAFEAHQA